MESERARERERVVCQLFNEWMSEFVCVWEGWVAGPYSTKDNRTWPKGCKFVENLKVFEDRMPSIAVAPCINRVPKISIDMCIYMDIYICVYVCVCVYIYIYIYIYIHASTECLKYPKICVYIYGCICVRVYICIYIYIHTCIHIYVHTYM